MSDAVGYLACYHCGRVAFWLQRLPDGEHDILYATDVFRDDGLIAQDGQIPMCQRCGKEARPALERVVVTKRDSDG